MYLAKLKRDLTRTRFRLANFAKRLGESLPRGNSGNEEELRAEINKIRWWHSIDLGNGIVTPGENGPTARLREKLALIGMPQNLNGMTVLDVGAWDGFFSFAAEQRGARRVLATDSVCWDGGGWGTRAGFELARRVLRSKVHAMRIDVMDLSPDTVGTFDLVLFLGVLYHMRHPLLALEKIYRVTRKQLILETHVDLLDCPRPAMAFYPGNELCDDPSNWSGPNVPMVEAMLRTAGFREARLHAGPFYATPQSYRAVFHAWR
jgi:tRNA (mo5U34)-methyltransferase